MEAQHNTNYNHYPCYRGSVLRRPALKDITKECKNNNNSGILNASATANVIQHKNAQFAVLPANSEIGPIQDPRFRLLNQSIKSDAMSVTYAPINDYCFGECPDTPSSKVYPTNPIKRHQLVVSNANPPVIEKIDPTRTTMTNDLRSKLFQLTLARNEKHKWDGSVYGIANCFDHPFDLLLLFWCETEFEIQHLVFLGHMRYLLFGDYASQKLQHAVASKESKTVDVSIQVEQLVLNYVRDIIVYMYCGNIPVYTLSQQLALVPMYTLVKRLQVRGNIALLIYSQIRKHLNPGNCVDILLQCEQLNVKNAREDAIAFFLSNLNYIPEYTFRLIGVKLLLDLYQHAIKPNVEQAATINLYHNNLSQQLPANRNESQIGSNLIVFYVKAFMNHSNSNIIAREIVKQINNEEFDWSYVSLEQMLEMIKIVDCLYVSESCIWRCKTLRIYKAFITTLQMEFSPFQKQQREGIKNLSFETWQIILIHALHLSKETLDFAIQNYKKLNATNKSKSKSPWHFTSNFIWQKRLELYPTSNSTSTTTTTTTNNNNNNNLSGSGKGSASASASGPTDYYSIDHEVAIDYKLMDQAIAEIDTEKFEAIVHVQNHHHHPSLVYARPCKRERNMSNGCASSINCCNISSTGNNNNKSIESLSNSTNKAALVAVMPNYKTEVAKLTSDFEIHYSSDSSLNDITNSNSSICSNLSVSQHSCDDYKSVTLKKPGGAFCVECKIWRQKFDFTKSQWRNRPREYRRCKKCTGEVGSDSKPGTIQIGSLDSCNCTYRSFRRTPRANRFQYSPK